MRGQGHGAQCCRVVVPVSDEHLLTLLCFILSLILCTCTCVGLCLGVQVPKPGQNLQPVRSPGAGVTSGPELLCLDAGNSGPLKKWYMLLSTELSP